MQGRIQPFHVVHYVALRGEQILPPVVVKVHEADTPAGVEIRECGHPGLHGPVGKQAMAVIAIKRVVLSGEVGDDDVGVPIVVEVPEIHPHAGDTLAVVGERDTRFEASLGKLLPAIVVEEELFHAVVGHHDVGKPVRIVVGESHSECPALFGGNAGLLGHIFKGTVTHIAEQGAGHGGEFGGRTVEPG